MLSFKPKAKYTIGKNTLPQLSATHFSERRKTTPTRIGRPFRQHFINDYMKKKVLFNVIVIIILLLHFFSCEKIYIYGDIVEDSFLLNDLYDNSKDTLFIGSSSYILEVDLNRNFFPSFGPTNKKLFAYICIIDTDSLPVPNTIEINKLYVIKNQQIWISDPLKLEDVSVPEFKNCRYSKNGPKWDTGIFVDVVIRVEDRSTMTSYGLIAKEQYISRIE
jgi:hypothetical protein